MHIKFDANVTKEDMEKFYGPRINGNGYIKFNQKRGVPASSLQIQSRKKVDI
jgi:hypothetical protein